MLQPTSQTESRGLERTCQAVSPMDDPCNTLASFYCERCGQWFCDIHADDESWHACVLAPGDEGGEG
jgi:hypothetical protein